MDDSVYLTRCCSEVSWRCTLADDVDMVIYLLYVFCHKLKLRIWNFFKYTNIWSSPNVVKETRVLYRAHLLWSSPWYVYKIYLTHVYSIENGVIYPSLSLTYTVSIENNIFAHEKDHNLAVHDWLHAIYCNSLLTHWGRVTHICVSKLTIVGSDNGLSPGRRQAIIWTNARILLIGPLETNFSEILIKIHKFSSKKMLLKMSSAKWRPFCLGFNELTFLGSSPGPVIARCSVDHQMVRPRLQNPFHLCQQRYSPTHALFHGVILPV